MGEIQEIADRAVVRLQQKCCSLIRHCKHIKHVYILCVIYKCDINHFNLEYNVFFSLLRKLAVLPNKLALNVLYAHIVQSKFDFSDNCVQNKREQEYSTIYM